MLISIDEDDLERQAANGMRELFNMAGNLSDRMGEVNLYTCEEVEMIGLLEYLFLPCTATHVIRAIINILDALSLTKDYKV